jgi:hypothetical protein
MTTIHLKLEQEQVIGEAIQAGLIDTADEAIELGVENIRHLLDARRKVSVYPAQNLVELFMNSPLAGMEINFERDKGSGREVAEWTLGLG